MERAIKTRHRLMAFIVNSITKKKYVQMLKQRYISCLVALTKSQINKGIREIKNFYPKNIFFKDILICIKYKK